MGTITSGVDLAKSVFPVGDAGGAGHVAQRQDLQREAFARWLAQRPVVNIVPDASSLRLEGPRRKPDAPGLTGRPPAERLGASRIPGATIDSRLPQSMGTTMARFVIEPHVAIALAAANAEIPKQHKLFAPTLLRSQVLALLFAEVQAGRLTRAEASRLLDYLRGLHIRLLGDRVLQRVAWDIALQLGWSDTFAAEYLALTKLQCDALVTDAPGLADSARRIVAVVPMRDLLA